MLSTILLGVRERACTQQTSRTLPSVVVSLPATPVKRAATFLHSSMVWGKGLLTTLQPFSLLCSVLVSEGDTHSLTASVSLHSLIYVPKGCRSD